MGWGLMVTIKLTWMEIKWLKCIVIKRLKEAVGPSSKDVWMDLSISIGNGTRIRYEIYFDLNSSWSCSVVLPITTQIFFSQRIIKQRLLPNTKLNPGTNRACETFFLPRDFTSFFIKAYSKNTWPNQQLLYDNKRKAWLVIPSGLDLACTKLFFADWKDITRQVFFSKYKKRPWAE